MKEELIAGLKNALEHGFTLEEAMQSFINAGYNPTEVKEAGKSLSSGASDIIFSGKEENALPPLPSLPKKENIQKNTMSPNIKEKSGKGIIIAIVILVCVVFLGGAGLLIYYFTQNGG